MPENIGPQIGVPGYQSFRRQMDSIVQVSKELASEMKAVTSAYDKNDQSQEKLAAQMGVLDKQIQNQSKRVEMLGRQYQDAEKRVADLNDELQKAVREHGEASKEATSLHGRRTPQAERGRSITTPPPRSTKWAGKWPTLKTRQKALQTA